MIYFRKKRKIILWLCQSVAICNQKQSTRYTFLFCLWKCDINALKNYRWNHLVLLQYEKIHGTERYFLNVKISQLFYRNLNCKPRLLDAKDFSAQKRLRLIWDNIIAINLPHKKKCLQDFLGPNRIALVRQVNTITCQKNSLRQGKISSIPELGLDVFK